MNKVLKIFVSLLLCISSSSLVISLHYWRIGLDPVGGGLYAFMMLLLYGSPFYIVAILVFYGIIMRIKNASVYHYIVIGGALGALFPLVFGVVLSMIAFFDILGFPVDIVGHLISGAVYGWLYYSWIDKENVLQKTVNT